VELDSATPLDNHYLDYAPSLQEIQEVESDMYLSDRWNKETNSLVNSMKSLNTQEMINMKPENEDQGSGKLSPSMEE